MSKTVLPWPSYPFDKGAGRGAITGTQALSLLSFARDRRAMREAHEDPDRRCRKACVFCAVS